MLGPWIDDRVGEQEDAAAHSMINACLGGSIPHADLPAHAMAILSQRMQVKHRNRGAWLWQRSKSNWEWERVSRQVSHIDAGT